MENVYIPFASEILEVIRHTEKEYTFRMEFRGIVKPGQFFEVSIPKFGEAPISVSGIGENFVDLTIRRVGRVTNEVFEHYQGQKLLMRGPYGNGFDVGSFLNGETVVVAGGTGVSPVRGVIEALSTSEQAKKKYVIVGFRSRASESDPHRGPGRGGLCRQRRPGHKVHPGPAPGRSFQRQGRGRGSSRHDALYHYRAAEERLPG